MPSPSDDPAGAADARYTRAIVIAGKLILCRAEAVVDEEGRSRVALVTPWSDDYDFLGSDELDAVGSLTCWMIEEGMIGPEFLLH